DDVCVGKLAGEGKRGFDAVAEIDADDLFGSPLGGELCMTALSAAALEYDLAFKERRCDGLEPAEELLVVFGILLGEVGPLPAEVLSSLGLVGLDLAEIGKARNTADDLIFAV